ncbi:MAG: CBS domain-containing protein, partial [Candidatus Polarisedimenticolia bacterium]
GNGRQVGAARSGRRILRAADLMSRNPIVVTENLTVGQLCDLLQEKNINGAPVVDERGRLVGVVTQEDIIYGAMGNTEMPGPAGMSRPAPPLPEERPSPKGTPGRRSGRVVADILRQGGLRPVPPATPREGEKPFWSEPGRPDALQMPVRAIMTSPAISAEEDTPVTDLCRIMWSLRIHRVPILRAGKVTGLVSSLDLCRAILAGQIRI